MFGHWLNRILNGAPNINRWQGRVTLCNNTDSSHMWAVAVIADGLARWEMEKFNNKVDVELLLKKCIFHDCLEVETGDILSGVKRKTKAMSDAIENVEEILYKERLEKYIPASWQEEYKGYLLDPKDGKKTIEGKILAAADSISALNECIQEVKLGNKTFKPYLSEVAKDILDIDLDSAKHFIKYSLQDFGLPIEYYGDDIVNFIKSNK